MEQPKIDVSEVLAELLKINKHAASDYEAIIQRKKAEFYKAQAVRLTEIMTQAKSQQKEG